MTEVPDRLRAPADGAIPEGERTGRRPGSVRRVAPFLVRALPDAAVASRPGSQVIDRFVIRGMAAGAVG
jgi:hypothetical protein